MATIKRAGGRIVTKVSNGVRRVSCSCCCFCRSYDLDFMLYSAGADLDRGHNYLSLLKEDCGDEAAFDALRPDGRYKKRRACLRWLCRQTVLGDDGPITISSTIGGPTVNERDLNDLIFECLGERDGFAGLANGDEELDLPAEEYGNCYLYGFEFYGWWRKRRAPWQNGAGWPTDFVGSDLFYDIYRRDTPIV